jgi:hypothetical protein
MAAAKSCLDASITEGRHPVIVLRGAEHPTPTHAVWLAKGVIRTGTTGPDKAIAAARDYAAAFLDQNLRDRPEERLFAGNWITMTPLSPPRAIRVRETVEMVQEALRLDDCDGNRCAEFPGLARREKWESGGRRLRR